MIFFRNKVVARGIDPVDIDGIIKQLTSVGFEIAFMNGM